jgi:hypothetical protein
MTAMLKSQRGLSDLSLLARSQLGQTRLLPVARAAHLIPVDEVQVAPSDGELVR